VATQPWVSGCSTGPVQEKPMVTRSPDQIRSFIEDQVALWNAKDHDAFFALYQAFAPGGFSFENPVNSGIHNGLEPLEAMWKDHVDRVKIEIRHLCVNGHEAAALMANVYEVDGQKGEMLSIETYHFPENGSFHARYFH
jgi:hypothetical protein